MCVHLCRFHIRVYSVLVFGLFVCLFLRRVLLIPLFQPLALPCLAVLIQVCLYFAPMYWIVVRCHVCAGTQTLDLCRTKCSYLHRISLIQVLMTKSRKHLYYLLFTGILYENLILSTWAVST